VLYDNLLEALDRGERRSVIAHELSHAENQDVPRGLLWLALVTPLALLLSSQLASSFSGREGRELGAPAALPALALALAVVSFGVGVVGNQLSREVEAKADTRALELTDDPKSLIRLQREIALRNVTDPDPPEPYRLLFASHPSTVERIGAALAWERGERP
jgi:STE24 endopeptidase